jgi:lipopolysaccharide export system permease protein
MPSRLTRYVLIEIVKIFVVSLFTLTTMILFIGVGRELIRQGLGIVSVIKLLPYVLPISLQFAFPATALFAVCSVYGRMAADGEVSTVKASGISPVRLLYPAIIFAVLLSPAAVYVSDLAVSWGRPGVNRVVLTSIEDIAYRVLQSEHSYTSDHGFSIHVRDVQGKKLIHPTVSLQNKSRSNGPVKLTAREGELTLNPQTQTLVLKVVDSQVEAGGKFQSIVPGENEFPIALGAMSEKAPEYRSPGELPLYLVSTQIIHQDNATRAAQGRLAAQIGFSILESRNESISGEEGQTINVELENSRHRLNRLRIEPWRRWAWGFSCLSFVLVGAPLAMIAKTADHWTTFGVCFLPTLIVYYPLFIFGLEGAKDGNLPIYGVWTGNIVCFFIAAMLILKVRRH